MGQSGVISSRLCQMTLARLLDGFSLVAHGVLSYCDRSNSGIEVADSAPGGYPLPHHRAL